MPLEGFVTIVKPFIHRNNLIIPHYRYLLRRATHIPNVSHLVLGGH